MIRFRRVIDTAVVGVLFVAASMGLITGHAAAAGPAISLTTSPVTLNLVVKPGTTTTKELKLTNNSKVPVKIDMRLDLFGPSGTAGEAAITAAPPNDPSPSWVNFSPSSFTANPGVVNTVKMTIDLPKTASLGYYYAAIFQPSIATQNGPGTATVKGSNAILVLVDTQSSNESRQINVASFTVSKHVYQYLPATFSVNIRNSGNIYLAPTGNVFISRSANGAHTLATLDINPGDANVLPHSNRVFTVQWKDGFPVYQPKMGANGQPVVDKKGNVVQQLVWNTSAPVSKIRFGKYYAQLTLVYVANGKVIPVTGVVSFWVIPWELVFLLLLVLLVFAGLIFAVVRLKLEKKRRGRATS